MCVYSLVLQESLVNYETTNNAVKGMTKYDKLEEYLTHRPAMKGKCILSFQEIEEIIGQKLPKKAREDQFWWLNTFMSKQAEAWLDAGWKMAGLDMHSKKVKFERMTKQDLEELERQERIIKGAIKEIFTSNDVQNGESLRTKRNYRNLYRFLKQIPADQNQVALSFKNIGTLIGARLPQTAYSRKSWWANKISTAQGSAWLKGGWLIENIYLKAEIATFRRKGERLVRSIPRYVRGLLETSANLGKPTPYTLAKWIRFCRRVGWYFEAKVLYERGGLNTESFNDEECAEVDEDYAVCKRELYRCGQLLQEMTGGSNHVKN